MNMILRIGEVCAFVTGESQYLSFHGVGVHYRMIAPQDGARQRVMLLSSPLISTFHWRKIVPELTQLGCMVVLIDLPGFGKSACGMNVPQDGAMRSNILWGVLDEIDRQSEQPDSLWHLVGHGSACATILEMAALYPDSVKSQVHIAPLMSTNVPSRENSPARWFNETVRQKDNFRRMIEHYSGYPMDDYIVDRMRSPLLRPGARECFLRMLREGREAPECELGFCPAMVLIGGRDALMSRESRDMIAQRLNGAESHVLKSAGHFPMETHSKALRDYLRGWLRFNA